MEIDLTFDQEERLMREGLRDAMQSLKQLIDATLEGGDELSYAEKEDLAGHITYLKAMRQAYKYFSVCDEWAEIDEQFSVDEDQAFELLTGLSIEDAIDGILSSMFDDVDGLQFESMLEEEPMTEENQIPVSAEKAAEIDRLIAAGRFSYEEKWHPEAESQGREARLLGFEQDDPAANPYLQYGRDHWMQRSFVAGWCDADQDIAAGNAPGRDLRTRKPDLLIDENDL